jgi:hypothetical protein
MLQTARKQSRIWSRSIKIRIVAKAKAEAESKRLQGQGIADQREEIARGLVESVDVLELVSTLKHLP